MFIRLKMIVNKQLFICLHSKFVKASPSLLMKAQYRVDATRAKAAEVPNLIQVELESSAVSGGMGITMSFGV